MGEVLSFALLSLSAMFVIVDPVGMVPLFLAFTPHDSSERRAQIAKRACLVAWGVLTAFALGGTVLFNLLGVTLSAFKVAGGLLLLLTAIDQLRSGTHPTLAVEEEAAEEKDDISIVPLALPLLAGPGSIATSMVLVSRATATWQTVIVLFAIAATLGLTYVTLRLAHPLSQWLGNTGMLISARLIALVLAAIGVQFMLDGVIEAIRA